MKKLLSILTLIGISASAYAATASFQTEEGLKWTTLNPNNLPLIHRIDDALIDVLKDNEGILVLPKARETKAHTIKGKYFPSTTSYILQFSIKKHYRGVQGKEYIDEIKKDLPKFRRLFIQEVKEAIVRTTNNWHKRYTSGPLRYFIRQQDRIINEAKGKLKGNIANLKSKLRSDEAYTKNWYRPKIENGSKTKAHLKGRLIEMKNEFNAKVDVLEQEFDAFVKSKLDVRKAKLDLANKIRTKDISLTTLNNLKVRDNIFQEVLAYDHDKYVNQATAFNKKTEEQLQNYGLDLELSVQ